MRNIIVVDVSKETSQKIGCISSSLRSSNIGRQIGVILNDPGSVFRSVAIATRRQGKFIARQADFRCSEIVVVTPATSTSPLVEAS